MRRILIESASQNIKAEAQCLMEEFTRYREDFMACCNEGIDHNCTTLERTEFTNKAFETLSDRKAMDI